MTSWKLAGDSAQWADGSAVLSFDRTAPGNGLKVFIPPILTEPTLQLFDTGLQDDNRSAFGTPTRVGYFGTSIHATFAENDHFRLTTQVDWRVNGAEAGYTSIDVVVSAGSQRLNAYAELSLRSRVKSADILVPKAFPLGRIDDWIHVGPLGYLGTTRETPCTLFRLPDTGLSYVEMIHPNDLRSHEISHEPDSGHVVSRYRLFSCPLEKGVILRARLRGTLLPRDSDCTAAAALFAQFAAADPPLGR